MSNQEVVDLEKCGVLGGETPAETLPEEMMSEEFLDSPLGRIMQALAGLEVAVKAFEARIGQCEKYVTYLLAQDEHFGPQIRDLSKKCDAVAYTEQGVANEGQDK